MNAVITGPQAATSSSTSIRVSRATRDSLARAAANADLSLVKYLERVGRQAERDRAIADFHRWMAQAYEDPEFAEEMRQWEQMDDGWSEHLD